MSELWQRVVEVYHDTLRESLGDEDLREGLSIEMQLVTAETPPEEIRLGPQTKTEVMPLVRIRTTVALKDCEEKSVTVGIPVQSQAPALKAARRTGHWMAVAFRRTFKRSFVPR